MRLFLSLSSLHGLMPAWVSKYQWDYFYLYYMDSNKTAGEEARWQLHKNAASNLEQVLVATPHKTPAVQPPASYHENYSS